MKNKELSNRLSNWLQQQKIWIGRNMKKKKKKTDWEMTKWC